MAKRLQEVLNTTSEPEMIAAHIYDTVIEAVRPNLVATKILALRIGPQGIPGSSVDIVTQDADSMLAHEIAEGAEIPINREKVSSFNLKPVKYGLRPLITKEMIEDNKWDIVQRNLQEGGYTMQKQLDTLVMAQLKAGADAASHTTSAGSAITPAYIAAAMNYLEESNYNCTDFIIHPDLAEDIRNIDTFVEADKAGVTDPSKSLIGTIYGMRLWVSTNGTSDSTYKYGFICDKAHALVLAEKRPITIERYVDTTKDLSGVTITARWKARYLRSEACAYVYTT